MRFSHSSRLGLLGPRPPRARAALSPADRAQTDTDRLPDGIRVTYEIVTVAGKWRRPARRGYGGCTLRAIRQGAINRCPDEIRKGQRPPRFSRDIDEQHRLFVCTYVVVARTTEKEKVVASR